MIASMTGYGKGVFATDTLKITTEIKSINSKQLDMILRLPPIFRDMETALRNRLTTLLERGKVEVTVNSEMLKKEAPIRFNTEILADYKSRVENLSKELSITPPADWIPVLFRLPDAFSTESEEADESGRKALTESILLAAEHLRESRIKEGRGLYEFFFEKIERIREYLRLTEQYEGRRTEKVRERLQQQLSKLQGVEIDAGRLEQEMIFYIEKLDVTEEKQRLRSHLTYFEETLGEPEEETVAGKGKKLGFISQEIGREINTLGSKSNDADMQKLVVMMKDELEQIKEQVLNVL